MQILMSHCKQKTGVPPQQALKHTIFVESSRREAAAKQQMINATVAASKLVIFIP